MRYDCEFRSVRLGGRRPVAEVLRDFAGDGAVVCLRGSWAGGSDLIASEPVTVQSGGIDPLIPMRQPFRLTGSVPEPGSRKVGGGWFAVLGYPSGRPAVAADRRQQTWLAFYDHLLRWDRVDREWWFESLWTPERDAELARRQDQLTARLEGSVTVSRPNYRAGLFASDDATEHLQTVERCISHVRAGDIFQVNAALRIEAEFEGSAISLFADVSEQLQPAQAAFADTGASVLAGFSPELFLRRRGRTVTTSPIKGTRPRIGIADEHEADILRASAKDAAENVMIVDLMRNDLGRVCLPGSVRAPALLEVQPHPGVWHLVSTVTGELPDAVDDADLLAATFPPGSVTGAPKSSAMRIIDRYESGLREAFSGAVGFSSPVYGAEFAVTIRSFQIADGQISLWVGGGITVDSVPIEEWRECLTKARPLLRAAGFRLRPSPTGSPEHGTVLPASLVDERPQISDLSQVTDFSQISELSQAAELPQASEGLLETVLVRDGRAVGLADHLARLERSSRELYGRPLPDDLAAQITCRAATETRGRLRVVVRPNGSAPNGGALDIAVSVAPLAGPTGIRRLVTAFRPGIVWRHKYADRRWLTAAEQAAEQADGQADGQADEQQAGDGVLPLFVDATGGVLETTRGNVFIVSGNELLTPPATDAILPGVTRRLVLDAAFDLGVTVRIEPTPLDRIFSCDGMFTTSAISELTHIDELDGVSLPAAGALEQAVAEAVRARD